MDNETRYDIINLLRKYKTDLHYKNQLIEKENKQKYNDYDYDIIKNTTRINEIKSILKKICQHQWITDYIDDKYGSSQQIIYCFNCELSRKDV